MGQHDIGDYFKNRVEGQSMEIDTDAVWNSLDLPMKNKKRRFLWIYLVGGIFLIFSSLMFLNSGHDTELKSTAVVLHKKVEEAQAENVAITNIEINQDDQEKTIILNTEKNKKNNLESTIINQNPSQALNSSSYQNIQTAPIEKDNLIIPDNGNDASGLIQTSQTSKTSLELISLQSESNFNDIAEGTIPDNNSKSRVDFKDAETIVSDNAGKNFVSLRGIKSLSINPLDLTAERDLSSAFIIDPVEIYIKSRPRILLELYTGVATIESKLTSSDDNIQTYLDTRRNTEQPLELLMYGGEVSLQFGSGLRLGAGLEMQTLNEVFRYDRVSVETTLVSTAFGNTFETTESTEQWIHYNKHKYIILPISMGYHFAKKKWQMGFTATGLVNFESSYSGKNLMVNNEVRDNSFDYTNGVNLGWRMNLSLARVINEVWSVSVNPLFQVSNQSLMGADFQFNQGQRAFGATFALMRRI